MTQMLSKKGQVTVPKAVRDHLGIAPGSEVRFRLADDGNVIIENAAAENARPIREPARQRRTWHEHRRIDGIAARRAGMTLVDFNVLLDVITAGQHWAAWSESQLEHAALKGPLAINDVIYAGCSTRFESVNELEPRSRLSASSCNRRRGPRCFSPARLAAAIAGPAAFAPVSFRTSSSARTL